MRASRGFTLIEMAMTIVLASLLASAFVTLLAPQINLYFFVPQRARIQAAAQEVLDTAVEGDASAPGIRFAIGTAITTADESTFAYAALRPDGTTATVTFAYDSVNRRLTRQVDAGAAVPVPQHALVGSDLQVDPLENNHLASPAFFRYFNAAGTEFTGTPTTGISRVDLAIRASSGTAQVKDSEAQVALKTGVEIKRYTT